MSPFTHGADVPMSSGGVKKWRFPLRVVGLMFWHVGKSVLFELGMLYESS